MKNFIFLFVYKTTVGEVIERAVQEYYPDNFCENVRQYVIFTVLNTSLSVTYYHLYIGSTVLL